MLARAIEPKIEKTLGRFVFGFKIDTLPFTDKGKDKLIENSIRVFSILAISYFIWNLTFASLPLFVACYIMAGINNFKFFQRNKCVELKFW